MQAWHTLRAVCPSHCAIKLHHQECCWCSSPLSSSSRPTFVCPVSMQFMGCTKQSLSSHPDVSMPQAMHVRTCVYACSWQFGEVPFCTQAVQITVSASLQICPSGVSLGKNRSPSIEHSFLRCSSVLLCLVALPRGLLTRQRSPLQPRRLTRCVCAAMMTLVHVRPFTIQQRLIASALHKRPLGMRGHFFCPTATRCVCAAMMVFAQD